MEKNIYLFPRKVAIIVNQQNPKQKNPQSKNVPNKEK